MGRYYYGDIEGKFWFGVQSSDAPSRFSKDAECEVNYIEYRFDEHHLEEVQEELMAIEKKLGDNLPKFQKFFAENLGYNDKMLEDAGLPITMLEDYADYELGKKIEQTIITTGECSFQAEL